MTEKRFTLHKGLDTLNIMDNTKFNEQIYINKSHKDMKLLVGLLNRLAEENNELKTENNRLIKSTADVVAEHQRKVFDLIDKKIAEYEEKNHDANSGDCICVKYYDQIDALKELKKELSK